LQIIAPPATLARVVAVNNILNALYMVLASIGCTLLAIFVNLWWLFVIFIIVNLIFVLWYWRNNYCHPVAI
jgi:hypothetical protein